uniref:Uncharacterized protein n=1 Tax=Strongyloides papillosus TaxID=174720 RepID=A0A0N5BXI0_STREA
MAPQKNKIDMSLDEIIKMNRKGSNKSFGEAKKSGVVKKIGKIGGKKIMKKANPVEAARNRTRIAAAKLAATKQLKGAQLNNKATQKVIRTIVAEVLKSKSINAINKTRISGKRGVRIGRDKNKLNKIQRTSRVISKANIKRPIRDVVRGGGANKNSRVVMPSTNIFKSRLIAHKLRGNDKIPQNNGRNNGIKNNFKNKFDNRINDRRPNQRSGGFKTKREHPSNFLKRNNGRY